MIKKIKSRVQSQKRHAGRTCSGGRFILEDLLIDTEDFVRGTCWTPLTGSGNTGACWLGTERTGSWAGCTGEFTERARVMDTGSEDKEGRKSRNTTTSFRREVRLGRTSTGILERGVFNRGTRAGSFTWDWNGAAQGLSWDEDLAISSDVGIEGLDDTGTTGTEGVVDAGTTGTLGCFEAVTGIEGLFEAGTGELSGSDKVGQRDINLGRLEI